MRAAGVTQTGHPGPWIRRTCGASSTSRPFLTIVWVWPPQISISGHSRVAVRRIAATMSAANLGSRYSLRCFRLPLHLAKHFQRLACLFFVDLLESKTGVGEHVVSWAYVRRTLDADASMDAAEANVGFEKSV